MLSMPSLPSKAPGKEAPVASAEIEVEPMEEGGELDLAGVPMEALEAELAKRKAQEGAGAPAVEA